MIRHKFDSLLSLLLTLLLTLMGAGACKTSKMSMKQIERQRLAEEEEKARRADSLYKAEQLRIALEQEEARKADSLRQAYLRYRMDSIAKSQKTIYGGPTMMDRRKKGLEAPSN